MTTETPKYRKVFGGWERDGLVRWDGDDPPYEWHEPLPFTITAQTLDAPITHFDIPVRTFRRRRNYWTGEVGYYEVG